MQNTITKYSASDAIKSLNGVSKKRLYEMMKDGSISYNKEPWGKGTRRIIDGAELARVFGNSFQPSINNETTNLYVSETNQKLTKTPQETTFLRIENEFLQKEISLLKTQINEKDKQEQRAEDREKDLLSKLDKAQQTISQQTLLIADMRSASQKEEAEKTSTRKGFWGWLLG